MVLWGSYPMFDNETPFRKESSMDVPITELPVVKALLKKYGVIRDIPVRELRVNGLKRIHNQERGLYSLITEAQYKERFGRCIALLKAFDGYIFAGHLDKIRMFMSCQRVITDDEMSYIAARGKKFIAAGIPPIFQQELYGHSSLHYWEFEGKENLPVPSVAVTFPTTDFIIQFATGAYDRKRVAIAMKTREVFGSHRVPILIQPATVQDVLDFRKVAFTDDGHISEILLREVNEYVATFFKCDRENLEGIIEHDKVAFLYLQEALRAIPYEPQGYLEWDGDVEVVFDWKWYLRYAPQDRIKIAKAYFDSLAEKPTGKYRKVFARMKAMFPELHGFWAESYDASERKALSDLVQNAISTGDYRAVPVRAFVEKPWSVELEASAGKMLQDLCERFGVEEPDKLFGPVVRFREYLQVPHFLPLLPGYKDIVDRVRIKAICGYSDDRFREIFTEDKFRTFMCGYTEPRSETKQELQDLIRVRHDALRGR